MVRYKPVPYRRGLEMLGWAIWDEKVSPKLDEEGLDPVFCSLDGEKPLTFRYLTGAYSWLAWCEEHGLDLEAGNVRADVYSDGREGGVVIIHESRDPGGPAVMGHPLARRDD